MKRSELVAKLKLGTWVRVHWDDITQEDEGWIEPQDSKADLSPCITVGYVIKIDRRKLVVAMTIGKKDKEVGTTWAIPIGCITEVEVWR